VLEGEAHYLLQSRSLDDVVMVRARAGDLVIIPPDYGHITINPSPHEILAMANIVSTAFESEYADYETSHGAAYFEFSSGDLKKNPNYPQVPPVRNIRPKSGLGDHRIVKGPLYDLIGNAKAVEFLNHPEKYVPVFTVLLKD
jgi:glucose-6-phosphate isomerase, archaeal